MRASVGLFLALLLPGCTLLQEPGPRELSGPTDGYTPTATYLKLHVKRDDGSTALLDFERRDWYTAEISRRVDLKQIAFVSAQAVPRDILNEYVAETVFAPEDLQSLKYDEMAATPEQRASMDAEHDKLLRDFADRATEAARMLPKDALP